MTEPQLLRFLAGELPEAERAAFEAHLASCPQCRQQFEQLRQTWETLGAWSVPARSPDLTARILAVATQSPAPSTIGWLRIAAALVIASAAGISAGLAMPTRPAIIARQVSTEDVVRSLGLDVFGSDTGLTDGLLDSAEGQLSQEKPQ